MADDLDFFQQPDERRNFALLIEDTQVFVCRELLACWSPVFEKIFFPEGAPFQQPEGGMEMKEKKLEDFLHFLRFICPSPQYTKKISEASVAALVAYADEYDVEVLRDHCSAFMAEQLDGGKVKREALIDYLRLASRHNLKVLENRLIPRVSQLPVKLIEAAHAVLPAPVLAEIYHSKVLQVRIHDAGCTGELPKDAFKCLRCSKPCAVSVGKSACCSKLVRMPSTVVAEALQQCAFLCVGCKTPCTLQLIDHCQRSTCCANYEVSVYPKCNACMKQTVGAAPAAKRHKKA